MHCKRNRNCGYGLLLLAWINITAQIEKRKSKNSKSALFHKRRRIGKSNRYNVIKLNYKREISQYTIIGIMEKKRLPFRDTLKYSRRKDR